MNPNLVVGVQYIEPLRNRGLVGSQAQSKGAFVIQTFILPALWSPQLFLPLLILSLWRHLLPYHPSLN